MTNSFENIVDIIIAILFLFIFPMILLNQDKDMIIQVNVENSVDTFISAVGTKGYVSKDMYDLLNESICKLLPEFEVVLEHERRIYCPPEEYAHSGKSKEIYISYYTDDILNEISKVYHLNQGDIFRVKLLQNENLETYSNSTIVRGGN